MRDPSLSSARLSFSSLPWGPEAHEDGDYASRTNRSVRFPGRTRCRIGFSLRRLRAHIGWSASCRAIANFFFKQVSGKNNQKLEVKDLDDLTTDVFMSVYDPGWKRRVGENSWVKSEFVNRLLSRGIKDRVSEQDSLKAADVVQSAFDAVGITSEFDKFMVLLSEVLGWPLDMLTYKKLKVIQNRPTIKDFPAEVIKYGSVAFRGTVDCITPCFLPFLGGWNVFSFLSRCSPLTATSMKH